MKSVAYLSIVPTAPDSTPGLPQHPKPALLYLTAVVRKVRMPRRRQAHAGAKRVQSLDPLAARHAKKVRWRCQLRTGTRRPVAQAGGAGNCTPYRDHFLPGGNFQRTPHSKTMWLIGFTGNPGARFAFCAAARWSGAHARSSTNPVLNYVSRETFACAAHCSAPQRLGGQFGNQ